MKFLAGLLLVSLALGCSTFDYDEDEFHLKVDGNGNLVTTQPNSVLRLTQAEGKKMIYEVYQLLHFVKDQHGIWHHHCENDGCDSNRAVELLRFTSKGKIEKDDVDMEKK